MRFFHRAAAGLLLCLAASIQGAIIYVPTDQATIQGGINAAASGDTVIIEDGYYYANAIIHGKQLTLASRFLLDGDINHILNTVIDGSQPFHPDTASCLIIYQPATVGSVVMGLTLTNGTGSVWFDHSFGFTYREGGGILLDLTTVRIQNNLIIGNRVPFSGPSVVSYGGGGIRHGWSSTPTEIIGNFIAWNDAGYGGGIHFFQSQGIIKNNMIFANSGGDDFGGGGMFIWENHLFMQIINNTVVANASALDGGGLSLKNCPAEIYNNIFRGNTAVTLGPQMRFVSGTSGAVVQYNNVQGGWAGTGNIDLSPLYQPFSLLLGAGSPSIDAGHTDPLYNDLEDPPSSGLAKYPSYGSLRNDQGAYGGPDAFPFPDFTNPELSFPYSEINYGNTLTGVQRDSQVVVIKHSLGQVAITDIQFRGPHNSEFNHQASVPFRSGTSPHDTLRQFLVNFYASVPMTLNDTMLVFHDDSTVASPIRILLKGKVANPTCCVGTTGNVDNDPGDAVDIGDLQKLVDYLFFSGGLSGCLLEQNVDKIGFVDIGDLQKLIDFLFLGQPLPAC